MLKTGEMLNMLNVFGDPLKKSARNRGNVKYVKCVKMFWEKSGWERPKHLTYLTFPLF